MNYISRIYIAELTLYESSRQACGAEPIQLTPQITSRGQYLAAISLLLTATTVRVRDGIALATDGPFAETREQLGG
jgi:hypothetical protein